MNKIYKVVWNTVRNCYVVGSELISSKSGRHSASNGKSSSLKVTLTVLALCGVKPVLALCRLRIVVNLIAVLSRLAET